MDRSIYLLKEGHQLSGFYQLSAYSYQLASVREIELEIRRLKTGLINQTANGKMFQQIYEQAFLLKEEIRNQKYAIQGGILKSANAYYSKLGYLIKVTEIRGQIHLQNEILRLYEHIGASISTIQRVQSTLAHHVKIIADVQQLISGRSHIEYLDFLAQLIQLQSIRGCVFDLLKLEDEQILILLNNNINYGVQLMSLAQQAKESVYLQVIEPVMQIWSYVLRQKLSDIGTNFLPDEDLKSNYDLVFYNAEVAMNLVKMLDFGDKRVNQFLLDTIARSSGEQRLQEKDCYIDAYFGVFYEFVHLSDALGFKNQLLEKMQQKWKSFLIKISVEKAAISSLVVQERYIIGFFTVLRYFSDTFQPAFLTKLRDSVFDNLIAVCDEMKLQTDRASLYKHEEDTVKTISCIIDDMYCFRKFIEILAKLGAVSRTELVENHINKTWIQLFAHHLNAHFQNRFNSEFSYISDSISFSAQGEWVKNAQLYYQTTCIAMQQFEAKIFKLFADYIDYIYIWLGKGRILHPQLEILLTLYGYYPKQLNTKTFYEILETFNEFFIATILQSFELKFQTANKYFDIYKLFVLLSALFPALKSAAVYIENSTYFASANIFNEILEILKARISTYFQKYVAQSFMRVLEAAFRLGAIPAEPDAPQKPIQNGVCLEKILMLAEELCQFYLDVLNGFNVYYLQYQLHRMCKSAFIHTICELKRNSVDRDLFCKFNELVYQFRKISTKQNIFQIDEYTSFGPIIAKCKGQPLTLINRYYGVVGEQRSNKLSRKLTALSLYEADISEEDVKLLCTWKCGQFIRQQQERLYIAFQYSMDIENAAFEQAVRAFELETTIPEQRIDFPRFFAVFRASGAYKKAVLKLQQYD